MLSLVLLLTTICCIATVKNDTIPANLNDVSEWIVDQDSNGKNVYYAIYKGELVKTNKTTITQAGLCIKHKVNCRLIVVGRKQNGRFQPKRITIL